MFEPKVAVEWVGALLWLIGVAGGAFLVSWVLTDVLHLGRAAYVGALAVLTGGLTAGYVAWSGSGWAFWVEGWLWGLVGAVLAGAFLAAMVSRMPGRRHDVSGFVSVWEGVVYGSAEGLLLSVLPVVITWQLFHALGWTDGWNAVVAGAAAIAASVAVIIVHHLGYREFRGPAIRSPIVGCTVLSFAYLLTANPFAAIGGHIILHLALLRRGMELPPQAPTHVPVPETRSESPRPSEMAVGRR